MSASENAERVKDFYQLILSDTEVAISRYVSEDIVWENPLPEMVPFGGSYHGIEGLVHYLTALAEEIVMAPLNFTDIIASDQMAAAVGIEEDTQVRRTGKSYTMPFVHVLRFNEQGKIFHVREYNDTREMIEAFDA